MGLGERQRHQRHHPRPQGDEARGQRETRQPGTQEPAGKVHERDGERAAILRPLVERPAQPIEPLLQAPPHRPRRYLGPAGDVRGRELLVVAEQNRGPIRFVQGEQRLGQSALGLYLAEQLIRSRPLPGSGGPRPRRRPRSRCRRRPAARAWFMPRTRRTPDSQEREGTSPPARLLGGHQPGVLQQVVRVFAPPDQMARQPAGPGRRVAASPPDSGSFSRSRLHGGSARPGCWDQ